MSQQTEAELWIDALGLSPHPEGGYFKEVYRSPEMSEPAGLPERYGEPRALGTSIYFLLRSEDVSKLHRLRSDEIWHFYAGTPLTLHILTPDGNYRTDLLGNDPGRGENLQVCVNRFHWFGATVNREESYSLVGCTMAPGFDFDDFELGEREELLSRYPEHEELISRLT